MSIIICSTRSKSFEGIYFSFEIQNLNALKKSSQLVFSFLEFITFFQLLVGYGFFCLKFSFRRNSFVLCLMGFVILFCAASKATNFVVKFMQYVASFFKVNCSKFFMTKNFW